MELEEVQNGKRKLDQEVKALQERLEELKAENAKLTRGKKKVQGEVRLFSALQHQYCYFSFPLTPTLSFGGPSFILLTYVLLPSHPTARRCYREPGEQSLPDCRSREETEEI